MKSVINLGAAEGAIHPEERRLLHRVLEFGDKTVRDLMVPRTKVVALPDTARFEDVRLPPAASTSSRAFPIYRGNLDNVVGILHAKDLFDLTDAAGEGLPARRPSGPAVPACRSSSAPRTLFREMRRRRTHMAVVVDEHGGTAGIVDDRGRDRGAPRARSRTSSTRRRAPGFVPGRRTHVPRSTATFRLQDLEEQFGVELPRDEAETIAGHLMLRFGRIPRKGERWKGRFADFVVEDATPTAIRQVRMILQPEGRTRIGRPDRRSTMIGVFPITIAGRTDPEEERRLTVETVVLIRGDGDRARSGRRRRRRSSRSARRAARLRGGGRRPRGGEDGRRSRCRPGCSRRSGGTGSR